MVTKEEIRVLFETLNACSSQWRAKVRSHSWKQGMKVLVVFIPGDPELWPLAKNTCTSFASNHVARSMKVNSLNGYQDKYTMYYSVHLGENTPAWYALINIEQEVTLPHALLRLNYGEADG